MLVHRPYQIKKKSFHDLKHLAFRLSERRHAKFSFQSACLLVFLSGALTNVGNSYKSNIVINIENTDEYSDSSQRIRA